LFEFWLKIFGVAFGFGVVSGIVMAFEFGTNWSELSRMSGPIQGPLLTYETFTAFALEAIFFGVLLFGRQRVAPWFYLLSTATLADGLRERIGLRPEDLVVNLVEVKRENWSFGSGEAQLV
jgi:cytochrome bd ubiquinol oxidase subunit I